MNSTTREKRGHSSAFFSVVLKWLRKGIRPMLVVALAASWVGRTASAEPTGWDCTAWRKQIPAIQLSNVNINVPTEKDAWAYLSRVYCVRPNRVDYAPDLVRYDSALNEIANRAFDFRAKTCTVGDLLDAVIERYDREWIQDRETGALWTYPSDFDFKKVGRLTIEVESPLLAVPMRSGVLDPYFELTQLGGIRIQLGPGGNIRGQYPIYYFAEYVVDIPEGTHSLPEILNLACAASPSQAFVLEYFYPIPTRGTAEMSREEMTLSTDSVQRPVSMCDVLAAYASRYLGAANGENVDTRDLGRLLSNPDPATRRAAQHYVEMTELRYAKDYQPHDELSLIGNLWYALAYDRYEKMSHEGYPRVSQYILDNVSDEFLLSSPDSHLVMLLALERARIERDFSWLRVVQKRAFEPVELEGLEHEVLYIARRYGVLWNALRQPEHEYFIDTGGWAATFMGEEYPEPYDGPSRNRPHPKGMH